MLATTRGAILRGTTEDEFGEAIDADTPAAGLGDIPVAITETSRDVFDPADGSYRTVRVLTGRLPGNIVVQPGDRLRDNRTGEVFIIDEDERQRRSISGRASVTLALRRTGG
jgi:hypothetical protein